MQKEMVRRGTKNPEAATASGFSGAISFLVAQHGSLRKKDIDYSKEMVFAHSKIFELYSSTFSVRVANCTSQNASFVL